MKETKHNLGLEKLYYSKTKALLTNYYIITTSKSTEQNKVVKTPSHTIYNITQTNTKLVIWRPTLKESAN